MTVPAKTDTALLGELRQLIEQARKLAPKISY